MSPIDWYALSETASLGRGSALIDVAQVMHACITCSRDSSDRISGLRGDLSDSTTFVTMALSAHTRRSGFFPACWVDSLGNRAEEERPFSQHGPCTVTSLSQSSTRTRQIVHIIPRLSHARYRSHLLDKPSKDLQHGWGIDGLYCW